MESTPAIIDAIIISCDIVGHGLEPDLARQVDRIRGLNDAIRVSLARFPEIGRASCRERV